MAERAQGNRKARKRINSRDGTPGPQELEALVAAAPWEAAEQRPDVLFTVRSAVWYFGDRDEDTLGVGTALNVAQNDFIQVVRIVDDKWWVGRIIGTGADCGIIPSPTGFWAKAAAQQALKQSKRKKRSESPTQLPEEKAVNLFNKQARFVDVPEGVVTFVPGKNNDTVYVLAPAMRPLVLIGPSTKRHEVTTMMQQALTGYLKTSFADRCEFLTVNTSKVKAAKKPIGRTMSMASDSSRASSGAVEDLFRPEDIVRMHQLSADGKLVIADGNIDDAVALKRSGSMAICVFVKIASPIVLSKLVKSRPNVQSRDLSEQLATTDKLNNTNELNFDLILSQSRLEKSCYEIAAFVDAYITEATLKPETPTRLQQLLQELGSF